MDYTCGAYFDLDSGLLLAIVDDRDGGFCCGSDGWASRVIYGDPFLLECAP